MIENKGHRPEATEIKQLIHDNEQHKMQVQHEDNTITERIHVRHLMRGQDYGRLVLGLLGGNEIPHIALGDKIKADGGLIQKKDLGLKQKTGDQLLDNRRICPERPARNE